METEEPTEANTSPTPTEHMPSTSSTSSTPSTSNTYLTVVVGSDGKIHNIGNGEHPTIIWANKTAGIVKSGLPKNAFCCSEAEYIKLMKEHNQVIKPPRYSPLTTDLTAREVNAQRMEAKMCDEPYDEIVVVCEDGVAA